MRPSSFCLHYYYCCFLPVALLLWQHLSSAPVVVEGAIRELIHIPHGDEETPTAGARVTKRRSALRTDRNLASFIPIGSSSGVMEATGGTTTTTTVPETSEATMVETESSGDNNDANAVAFDFIIAGFPKCGTTTLLKAFAAHEETDMAAREQCAIASPLQADVRVHRLLDETLAGLSPDPHMKRSFKCPTALYNYKGIARLQKHSPFAKIVVGTRHPVKMLQSFYNYRVTEIKEKGLSEPIPTLEEVLANPTPWKGVSLASTRFELFLMQLGKTAVTAKQMKELVEQQYDLAIKPSNFTVFLYTVDQLEDDDAARSLALRNTMQSFLGLKQPLEPFGHENKNHAGASLKESVDICHEKWASVRQTLIEYGAKTAAWIRDEFMKSPDVVVPNPEHFVQTLESWGVDPCLKVKTE